MRGAHAADAPLFFTSGVTLRVGLVLAVAMTAVAPASARDLDLDRDALAAAERAFRAEAGELDLAMESVTAAADELRDTAASLATWRAAFDAAQAQHAGWMAAFAAAQAAFDPARDLPLSRPFAELKRARQMLQKTLPDAARSEVREQQALQTLLDYIQQADRALPLIERAALAAGGRGTPIAGNLRSARTALAASLERAREAYTLLHAQAQSRARLTLTLQRLWDRRVDAAATRGAVEVAQDLDRQIPPAMQRALLPDHWRLNFQRHQRRIDALVLTPMLALREQRIAGSELDAKEACLRTREAEGEKVDDLRDALRTMRLKHARALDALTQLSAFETRERFIGRLAHMGSAAASYGDAESLCVQLARVATSDDPITSEEAYIQWSNICSEH